MTLWQRLRRRRYVGPGILGEGLPETGLETRDPREETSVIGGTWTPEIGSRPVPIEDAGYVSEVWPHPNGAIAWAVPDYCPDCGDLWTVHSEEWGCYVSDKPNGLCGCRSMPVGYVPKADRDALRERVIAAARELDDDGLWDGGGDRWWAVLQEIRSAVQAERAGRVEPRP